MPLSQPAGRLLLKLTEAARRLDLHPNTLRKLIDAGELPVCRTWGEMPRIHVEDLAEYAARLRSEARASHETRRLAQDREAIALVTGSRPYRPRGPYKRRGTSRNEARRSA